MLTNLSDEKRASFEIICNKKNPEKTNLILNVKDAILCAFTWD